MKDPLVVRAAGRADPAPQGMDAEAWRALGEEKRARRVDLATLSNRWRSASPAAITFSPTTPGW